MDVELIDLFKPVALGFIRHGIVVLGAAIVHSGYLDANQETQFAGALVTLAGLAWSAADKYAAKSATARAAATVPPTATAVDRATGQPIPGATVVNKPTALINHAA
jgi:hypothetical protein